MLQLFLNSILAVLPDDIEIDIERTSPVWNESGTFSYPFPVPYYPNVGIFGNLHSPESESRAVDLSFPFELYVSGILLLSGVAIVDNGLFDVDDNVPMTLSSGPNTFYAKIEGMMCTEVELIHPEPIMELVRNNDSSAYYWGTNYNIQMPYLRKERKHMFFNPTIITNPVEVTDFVVDKIEEVEVGGGWWNDGKGTVRYDFPTIEKKAVLKENRYIITPILNALQETGICFYLTYFMDCLFEKFDIKVERYDLDDYEDFHRLAMFTTRFDYIESGTSTKAYRYPTSMNFPDENIDTVIESIFNAFGIKLIFDEVKKSVDVVLVKNLLIEKKILKLDCDIIDNPKKIHEDGNKVVISYKRTGDTKFDYFKDSKNRTSHSGIHWTNNYEDIQYYMHYNNGNPALNETNTVLYADRRTGNTYRVKVDSGTYDEPALFEVGDFEAKTIGEGGNSIEMSIGFDPIITNQINRKEELMQYRYNERTAIYVNVDLTHTHSNIYHAEGRLRYTTKHYVLQPDELRKCEQPFVLGIMRGTGSDAKTTTTTGQTVGSSSVLGGETYVVTTGSNSAFNSDSIDLFGRYYDYNGEGQGLGYETDKIFSLKIDAGKPIDGPEGKPFTPIEAPDRGLYKTFLHEYVQFILIRKSVQMELLMTMSQLSSIDWKSKYRIGNSQYEGFFNKLKFKVSKNGISTITAEIYMI